MPKVREFVARAYPAHWTGKSWGFSFEISQMNSPKYPSIRIQAQSVDELVNKVLAWGKTLDRPYALKVIQTDGSRVFRGMFPAVERLFNDKLTEENKKIFNKVPTEPAL